MAAQVHRYRTNPRQSLAAIARHAPLYAYFELEIEAFTSLGQHANAAERTRQAQSRLFQGFGENYNFSATHLSNLLSLRRIERGLARTVDQSPT